MNGQGQTDQGSNIHVGDDNSSNNGIIGNGSNNTVNSGRNNEMLRNASHFNIHGSEFNNVGGNSNKTTYNANGGTQNVNQNHGTQSGNVNMGTRGGTYNVGMAPVPPIARIQQPVPRSQPNPYHQNGIRERREHVPDGNREDDIDRPNEREGTRGRNDAYRPPDAPAGPNASGYYWLAPLWVLSLALAVLAARAFR